MLQKEFKKQGDFLFRYRSYLPLIILVAGLAVFIQTKTSLSEAGVPFPGDIWLVVCLLVSLAGQIIRAVTVGYTPANTSGRNAAEQVADEINTSGIYSSVRHPLYVGNFFMWLGLAMLTANLWFIFSFVFLYWVYYERIMYAEEMFLVGKFGEAYENWAEKTPAFIPSFKNYRKPALSFSWKKVLKKEKNGITGIFVIFFIFNLIAQWIDAGWGKFSLEKDFWFYAAIFFVVFYLIFKYLKRKTTVLDEPGR